MTCEDFAASVQKLLTQREPNALTGDLLSHAASCTNCRGMYESSLALHRALQNLPRIASSGEFVARLRRIDELPSPYAKLSWMPEVRLAVGMLLPLGLPYLTDMFFSESLQFVLQALIVLLGLTFLGVVVLKPLILGGPSYRFAPKRA